MLHRKSASAETRRPAHPVGDRPKPPLPTSLRLSSSWCLRSQARPYPAPVAFRSMTGRPPGTVCRLPRGCWRTRRSSQPATAARRSPRTLFRLARASAGTACAPGSSAPGWGMAVRMGPGLTVLTRTPSAMTSCARPMEKLVTAPTHHVTFDRPMALPVPVEATRATSEETSSVCPGSPSWPAPGRSGPASHQEAPLRRVQIPPAD